MVLRKLGLKEDNMQYFSFDSVLIGKKTKNTLWEKIIDWLLNHFMPMANPTLEENLGYVKEWYLEYDDVEEYVNREVGLAENGLVVFKAPFEKTGGIGVIRKSGACCIK